MMYEPHERGYEEELEEALARIEQRRELEVLDLVDRSRFRLALEEALGYAPSEHQVLDFWDIAQAMYGRISQYGIRVDLIMYPWGRRPIHRDIYTGRFVSRDRATMALRDVMYVARS